MKVSHVFVEFISKKNNDPVFYLVYKAGDFLIYCEQSLMFMGRVRGVIIDEMDNNSFKLKIDRILSHENLPNCCSTDK